MKAFFIDEPGKTSFRDIPKPAVREGEVLLKLKRVGYCGSDLNTYRGRNPLVSYPRIPGHEIAAYIEEIGPGVPDLFSPGELITAVPYTNCGKCGGCLKNRPNVCEFNETLGVQREGSMTEYISLPYQKILKVNTEDPNVAAMIEPLAVGFHAARRGRPEKGETVVIFGCGLIGVGAILKSLRSGATVIAVDIDNGKLELAKTLGAHHVINSAEEDLQARVKELTEGIGPDLALEAVGFEGTYVQAIDVVSYAGRVVYVGYANGPVTYETKKFLLKELDICGSRGSEAEDFMDVIDMLEEDVIDINLLITRVVPFNEAGEAIAAWSENPGAVTKLILDL
ncbi:MAG: zinc-binding alcohol dehydrogenase family protein [Spirochaetales bacterium]|nr:zinc-binding alcohol dehydrogenase family protein [Spirochaetales bacterium]